MRVLITLAGLSSSKVSLPPAGPLLDPRSITVNGCSIANLHHPAQEADRIGAVDHPVVVAERQRQHLPRLDLAVR